MTIFGQAGHSCKTLRIFYLEKVLDPETQQVEIQRSWNYATDWSLYNKTKEDYHSSLQQYQ